jgi:sugar lactone lactonase YvrE
MHSGIGVLSDGRIVFEAPGGAALIFLDPATKKHVRIEVDVAVSHGIAVASDDTIWICDPGAQAPGQVVQINLDGKILRTIKQPVRSSDEQDKWRPTSIALAANGDIWIGDGYGLSLVHVVRANGAIETFDGSTSGTKFDCPHGVAIDTRESVNRIAVAERSNKRVLYFKEDGTFIRSVSAPIMTSPSSLAVRGNDLLVTDLFGAILAIDLDDRVRAILPTSNVNTRGGWPNKMSGADSVAPDVFEGMLNSPHGITVSVRGEVYFTEWYLGGRAVTIS